MKVQNSALAVCVSLAVGLVFADEATPSLEPVENLNKESASWFTASKSNPTGGAWNKTPADGETSGYLEVDSDSTQPLTFTVSSTSGLVDDNKIAEINLGMIASPVPATVNLAPPADGTKVGFAIKMTDATTAKYRVYLGGDDWVALDDTKDPVAADTETTLKIEIDRRYTPNKIRFTVGGDVIGGWKDLAASIGTEPSIDFVGSGQIQNLAGVKYTIISEKIDVTVGGGNVTIVIPEAIMADLQKAAGSKKVGEYLNESSGVTGMTRLDAKVLFNKTELTAADKTVVKGAPAAASAGKVRVAIAGLNVQEIGGANVTYQLEGSVDGTTNWTLIGAPQTSSDLEFEQSTPYRYFRVKTMVEYKSANK